jgi:eukaryotic-like serine/threonine-protein kinase
MSIKTGFTAGTRIGPYEIKSPLGEGGMGVVYRALDTELQREVALKLLPDHFSNDADRLARFQREAQVLASLNHPNIAQIYGLDGAGSSRCIVMELVDGETLQDRLKRGPIPVDEALPIAKQIAEALEAAHEKGIIHRDLKPANIKFNTADNIKVLDFGLAKVRETPGAVSSVSNSPTVLSGSMPGLIMGTAAYMSPEQAKGRQLDRRTDIFSFGCVLYEMLTGRPAFDGEDIADILSRVLQRDPDWTLLASNVPPRIRELLRLCLQKDLRHRRSDAADVRIDIEQALREPPEIAGSPAASRLRERLAWIVAAVLVITIGVLAIPASRYLREEGRPEMRLEITTPLSSVPFEFALSPDGMRLAFVAPENGVQRLWVRPLNAISAQALPGTDGADHPFWSPDSRSVGFFANQKLKRIELDGGSPQILADAQNGRGGAWNSDGIILFAANTYVPLSRIQATGGTPEIITHLEKGQTGHRFPQLLPDGRHFLFYAQGISERSGIYIGSLDNRDTKYVVAADTAGIWTPPDRLLYIRQGALRAQALNVSSGTLTGNPVTLADPVGYALNLNQGAFSVSAAGMVAYRSGTGARPQLTWFDRTGKKSGTVGDPDEGLGGYPELSPDGRRVAVSRMLQGNEDVWFIDLLRGGATRFTFDPETDSRPLWSPDGTQIVFNSDRKNAQDLYIKPSSGAGAEKLMLEAASTQTPYSWSPDSHLLLYGDNNAKTSLDLWALPMQGDRKPIPVATSLFFEGAGQFSPDGRWVAYQSNESGRMETYVVPFPAGGGKWQVSTNGGISPRWRHDGKELFFVGPDSQMMAATVSSSGLSFAAAPPVALFQTSIVGGGTSLQKHQYAVSADDRFLINITDDDSIKTPITLILNWKPRP